MYAWLNTYFVYPDLDAQTVEDVLTWQRLGVIACLKVAQTNRAGLVIVFCKGNILDILYDMCDDPRRGYCTELKCACCGGNRKDKTRTC